MVGVAVCWVALTESCKCFVDLTGHGEVNFVGLVIPINGDEAKVACAIPVHVAFIVLVEYCKEMFSVCFVGVLDAKIINNEREADGLPFVLPVSWCGGALLLASLE